jgi:hypothetical protein
VIRDYGFEEIVVDNLWPPMIQRMMSAGLGLGPRPTSHGTEGPRPSAAAASFARPAGAAPVPWFVSRGAMDFSRE